MTTNAIPGLRQDDIGELIDGVYETVLGAETLEPALDLMRRRLGAAAALVAIAPRAADKRRMVAGAGDWDILACCRDGGAREPAMGDFHVAGGNGRMAEPAELQLRLFRRGCEPPFSDEEQALCAMLVPHLVRAVRLSSRLRLTESELSFYAKALDRMLVGAVILDEKGHLLRATATAEAILGGRDGIRILGGRPHAEAPGEDRELQQIIRQALAAGTGEEAPARAISLTRPSGARNLGVVVQPIRQSDILAGPGRAAVALFIRDPERSAEIESEVLGRLFDFTPAEAAIARCFADGMSLERAASELDISRNTVRAHLRSIFSKSGISRQTELVRLLLNSAAVLGPAGRLGAHAAH